MALVHDGTMSATTNHDDAPAAGAPGPGAGAEPEPKRVYLVAAFRADGGDEGTGPGRAGGGTAEHVVAVMGMEGDRRRFEWVGRDQRDSVTNPARITPVQVSVGLPSPWHPSADGVITGLVQLAPDQLGDGTVDDDLDHLLTELGRSRDPSLGSSASRRSAEHRPR